MMACYRTSTFAKCCHQQFPFFKVTLLIFESQDAIEDLFATRDTLDLPTSTNLSNSSWKSIGPGQLVAVCLQGNEDAHALHVPVFGVVDANVPLLQDRANLLTTKLLGRRNTASEYLPLWRLPTIGVIKPSKGFLELAHEFANLGNDITRKYLYELEKSPALMASEGRRMAFKERWLYACVSNTVKELSSAGQWIKLAKDDTLLPTISVEWGSQDCLLLCSVTGYYFRLSHRPQFIILNRHYPHWRSSGVRSVQLIPPRLDFNHANVNERKDFDSPLETKLLKVQGLQFGGLVELERGLQDHPALSSALLKEMADFIFKLSQPPQSNSASSTLEWTRMRGLAELYKAISPDCIYRNGCAPEFTKADDINRLVLKALSYFGEITSLPEDHRRVFLDAFSIANASKNDSIASDIRDEIIKCFLLAFKYAVRNTRPLCGKAFVPNGGLDEAGYLEQGHAEGRLKQEAGIVVRNRLTQDKGFIERQQEQDDPILEAEDDSYPEYDDEPAEWDIENDDSSAIPPSFRLQRKRSLTAGPSDSRAKHARLEETGSLAVHGKRLRGLLRGAPDDSQETDDEDRGATTCAQIFNLCLNEEVANAKEIPKKAFDACQAYFDQKDNLTSECRALTLMMVVEEACAKAKEQNYNESWDWILLTLAYQAETVINDLVAKAQDGYNTSYKYESESSPTIFAACLRSGEDRFSKPLIQLVDRVRVLHETVLDRSKTRIGTVLIHYDIKKELVEAVLREKNGLASTLTSTALTGAMSSRVPTPAVYLIYQRLPVGKSENASSQGSIIRRQKERFQASVFDALFQTYFQPLVQYLTAKDLSGRIDNRTNNLKYWAMKRRFVMLRLQLVKELSEKCGMGTAVFAARCASDLVLAPERYFPLESEEDNSRGFYDMHKSYQFPPLLVNSGNGNELADEIASDEIWMTIYCSLKRFKSKVLQIAKKKNPDDIIQAMSRPI